MRLLRWLLILGCAACVAFVASRVRWSATLYASRTAFQMDCGRAPLWDPPPEPPFTRFAEHFRGERTFPREGEPVADVRVSFDENAAAAELLLLLWPWTLVVGIAYRIIRRRRRDDVLHAALWVGLGLTGAAASCLGTWLVFGGWGPPIPEIFGVTGVAIGLVVALQRSRTLDWRAGS